MLRWYYETSFAKQFVRGDQHSDRILRTETCSNDTYHFGVGRRLQNIPVLCEQFGATNERCLSEQAELLASAVEAVDIGRRDPLQSKAVGIDDFRKAEEEARFGNIAPS